jgi:hypothetical protein
MDKSLDELIKESSQSRPKKNKFSAKSKSTNSRASRIQEPYKVNNSARIVSQNMASTQSTSFVPPKMKITANLNMTNENLNTIKSGSIFDRLGNKSSQKLHASGTSVTIGNLNQDISLADLSELCGSVGEVLSATFVVSSLIKMKKQATVIFARRTDALTFVQKFHGCPLDNTPMDVKLTGENGKDNPFNPVPVPMQINSAPSGKNVRAGLFGTALDDGDDADDDGDNYDESGMIDYDDEDVDADDEDDGDGPTFSITMSNKNMVHPEYVHNHARSKGPPMVGQGGKGGRRGGRGPRREGGRRNQSKQEESATDLDNALDKYMSSR